MRHVIPLDVTTLHPDQLVQYYLMCSYLYYQVNISPIPDAAFDKLCVRIDQEWDTITHRHKALVDRAALKAGTGYQIDDYPLWVRCAADRWYFIDHAPAKRARRAGRPVAHQAALGGPARSTEAVSARRPARPRPRAEDRAAPSRAVHECTVDELINAVLQKVRTT